MGSSSRVEGPRIWAPHLAFALDVVSSESCSHAGHPHVLLQKRALTWSVLRFGADPTPPLPPDKKKGIHRRKTILATKHPVGNIHPLIQQSAFARTVSGCGQHGLGGLFNKDIARVLRAASTQAVDTGRWSRLCEKQSQLVQAKPS